MGFRFRKTIKIAPGLKLNIGKKSVGISTGGKYGGVSYNSRTGAKSRISLPGTGISYISASKNSKSKKPKKPKKPFYKRWYFWIILFLFVGSCTAAGNDSKPDASPEPAVISSTPAPTENVPATATPEPTPKIEEFILNTSTGKFHETYCSSISKMKDSNKQEYTGTREELIQRGYEPCDRCNP